MRGLEKYRMKRGQIDRYIDTWTSRLLDRIGPVGRFDENKTWLQCSISNVYFRYIDALAKHTNMAHKNENLNLQKCSQCELSFSSKEEMEQHLKQHKSYKPCRNFRSNSCELNEVCPFEHIILEQGQHICYKCGSITISKTKLMKHIKDKHGNEVCHKFLENKCDFGSRCLFRHTGLPVQNVDLDSTPARHTMQDFPNTLATGPVVRTEGRPQNQSLAPTWAQICQKDQNLIQTLTSQMMLMMNQMKNFQTILATLNRSPQ